MQVMQPNNININTNTNSVFVDAGWKPVEFAFDH